MMIMSREACVHQESADDISVLQLLGTPGIGPSRVRAIVERWLKSKLPLSRLINDADEVMRLLTVEEISLLHAKATAASKYAQLLRQNEVEIVPISSSRYPKCLKHRLGKAAPLALFCKGNLKLLQRISVGFCGSRRASIKGIEVAIDCSEQLSGAGINVVSGYAAGIDLATHTAALQSGGTTTIVLPEGIERFSIRKDLRATWNWSNVLVVSQFYPSVPWRVENAMRRNLVICGLSKALIVVEAGKTGGSIEAGRVALAADMPVYAPVYDGMPEAAAGNLELFSRGARKILKNRWTERAQMDALFEDIAGSEQGSLFDA
jgi:DNA processing protein